MKMLKVLLICVCVVLLAVPAGCVPYKELKELAIVEGVGVDVGADGRFIVTFQIYQSSGSGGSGSGGTNQVQVIQSNGSTLFETSREITKQMGKKLYYSNTRAVVLGRQVCERYLVTVLDFMERNHEIRPTQRIYMADGLAQDILMAKNSEGTIPAEELEKIGQNNKNTGQVVDLQAKTLLELTDAGFTDPEIPLLSVQKGPQSTLGSSSPSGSSSGSSSASGSSGSSSGSSGGASDVIEAIGTAIFNRGILVGTLDSLSTRGALWVENKIDGGDIIVFPKEGGGVSLEISNASAKTKVGEKNGKPAISVDVNFSTNLTEVQGISVSDDPKFYQELILLQNSEVRNEINSAIQNAFVSNHSDIFGFGQKIYETRPDLWRKVSADWDNSAGSTPVDIKVTSAIAHDGLITR